MAEIANIKVQLEQIVSDLGIPVLSGGSMDDYLTCVATGMIQFVCVRERRENYKSLTAENIQIHPGSSINELFKVCSVKLCVKLYALSLFDFVDSVFKFI